MAESDHENNFSLDFAEKEKLIKERDRAEKLQNLKMDLILFERWRQGLTKAGKEGIREGMVPEVLVEKYMKAINCDHSVNIKGVHFNCVETIVGHEIHRNPEAQAVWSGVSEVEEEEFRNTMERQASDIREMKAKWGDTDR